MLVALRFLGSIPTQSPISIHNTNAGCVREIGMIPHLLIILRSRSTKKPCHRFVLFFDCSLGLLPAPELCNKNI